MNAVAQPCVRDGIQHGGVGGDGSLHARPGSPKGCRNSYAVKTSAPHCGASISGTGSTQAQTSPERRPLTSKSPHRDHGHGVRLLWDLQRGLPPTQFRPLPLGSRPQYLQEGKAQSARPWRRGPVQAPERKTAFAGCAQPHAEEDQGASL